MTGILIVRGRFGQRQVKTETHRKMATLPQGKERLGPPKLEEAEKELP